MGIVFFFLFRSVGLIVFLVGEGRVRGRMMLLFYLQVVGQFFWGFCCCFLIGYFLSFRVVFSCLWQRQVGRVVFEIEWDFYSYYSVVFFGVELFWFFENRIEGRGFYSRWSRESSYFQCRLVDFVFKLYILRLRGWSVVWQWWFCWRFWYQRGYF